MENVLNVQLEFATALATVLLHSLWQCALLAAVAAIALQMLSRRSAALRHMIGMGFLLAMVGLPALSFVQIWSQPAGELGGGAPLTTTAQQIGKAFAVFGQQSKEWAAALSVLWLLGVATMLVRHLGGLWWIGALERRDFQRLPPEWQERFDALQRTMGITRKVVVRVTEDVLMPFTARLFRPIIWMPQSLLARLPREQVIALFAHELAHIRRLDWLWNGVQCIVEALLFFHPAMWWLSRRIREEREHACDDRAVTAYTDAIALAEALAELARDRQPSARLVLAANGGPLMNRIARLLSNAPTPARSWVPISLISILTASAVLAAQLAPAQHTGASASSETSRTQNAEHAAHFAERVARYAEQAAGAREQAASDAEQARRERTAATQLDTSQPASATSFSGLTGTMRVSAQDAEQARRGAERARREGTADARHTGPAGRIGPPTWAIVRLVTAHPSIVTALGSPAAVSSDGFTGSWQLDDGDPERFGQIQISFALTGPKGRAKIWVSASATQPGQQWKLTGLNITDFTPGR